MGTTYYEADFKTPKEWTFSQLKRCKQLYRGFVMGLRRQSKALGGSYHIHPQVKHAAAEKAMNRVNCEHKKYKEWTYLHKKTQ